MNIYICEGHARSGQLEKIFLIEADSHAQAHSLAASFFASGYKTRLATDREKVLYAATLKVATWQP